MAMLYVENVPEDLYDALKAHARAHGKSISAAMLGLLAENIPTAAELARRKELVSLARKLRSERPTVSGPFQTTEEMQREDRER